jgi:hypothetical protein
MATDTIDFYALADSAAEANGVDPYLLRGVMDTESLGTDRAKARSSAGAVGPMQLMGDAAQDVGVDRADPEENVLGGAKYLAKLQQQFGNDRDALMAYNWGPGNVRKWQAAGSPPDAVPQETQTYLDRVYGFRAKHAAGAQKETQVNVQPSGGEAPETSYELRVDGVPFTVTSRGTREEAAQELVRTLDANPDLLGQAAAKNGMRYDWQTGRAREYNLVEKIGIGYGKVVNDAVTGIEQLGAMVSGNAEKLQRMKDMTDDERELYSRLGKEGAMDPTDVGELLAVAPMLFGPTGILRVAAGYGLLGGINATGNEDSRLGNAAESGVAALVGGAAGNIPGTLYKLAKGLGAGTLAKGAAAVLIDTIATGGLVSAGTLGGKLLKLGRKVLETDTRVAGRGPNAYDRSGSAGPDMGADPKVAGQLISSFLTDMGHEMKDAVNQQLAHMIQQMDNPSAAADLVQVLTSRLAANLSAEKANEEAP